MYSAKNILFSSVLLLSFTLQAALPPLSQEARESMATDIVTGTIVSSDAVVRGERRSFSNTHYTVKLLVTDVTKGDVEVGSTIDFSYKRAQDRPAGFCGPIGQNRIVTVGSTITAYLSSHDGLSLLEPNGFDEVSN